MLGENSYNSRSGIRVLAWSQAPAETPAFSRAPPLLPIHGLALQLSHLCISSLSGIHSTVFSGYLELIMQGKKPWPADGAL